ncbi:MAG: hypothetical protein KDA42_02640 [Planctomycetales bacterium]|nr:hypothetical protein [Planctomycetales bacterium]
MPTNSTTPSIRKAAILLASLDPISAEQLLARLSPREARLVRRAADEVDQVSTAERAEVAQELAGGNPAPSQRSQPAPLNQLAGIELDGSLATALNLTEPVKPTSEPTDIPLETAIHDTPFSYLDDVDSASLARHLSEEHPQVIAVVVSHLSDRQAARLLVQLSPSRQRDVVRRLELLDDSDTESVQEIEHHLRRWFTKQTDYRAKRSSGSQAVERILAAADPDCRETLLGNLGRRTTAAATAASTYSTSADTALATPNRRLNSARTIGRFEELADLQRSLLGPLLREAEPELLALALTGASEHVVAHICSALPQPVARALRHALDHPGPMRLSDVEMAREELTRLANAMANRSTQPPAASRLSFAA